MGRIWGVDAKGKKRVHDLGIRTLGEVAALPEKVVSDRFAEMGHRSVVPDREAKSVRIERRLPPPPIAPRHSSPARSRTVTVPMPPLAV